MRANLRTISAQLQRRSSNRVHQYSTIPVISTQAHPHAKAPKDKIVAAPLEPESYPLPGKTTSLYSYQLSKLPNIMQQRSLDDTPIIKEELPAQNLVNVLKMFGEMSKAEKCQIQLKPIDDNHKFDMIVQTSPDIVKHEFATLFPDRKSTISEKPLTIVSLAQKTITDQRVWSEPMENERDMLTDHFIDTASSIVDSLREEGYWADFIDPSSGRPYLGPFTNDALFECDSRLCHVGGMYIEDLGCCKVISHHKWGTYAFIGTIFTDAPTDAPELVILRNEVNAI